MKTATATRERTSPLREARIRQEEPAPILSELDQIYRTAPQDEIQQQRVTIQADREALDSALKQEIDTHTELRAIIQGLQASMQQAGVDISEAYDMRGREKLYDGLGRFFGSESLRNRAVALQRERIDTLTTVELCANIRNQARAAQQRAADSLDQMAKTRDDYEAVITSQLAKLEQAQPAYMSKMEAVRELTGQRDELKLVLDSGTLELSVRPAKEQEYEDVQRKLSLAEREVRQLAIEVKVSQESIPELQRSREAAVKTIESLEQMRRELHEELNAYLVVLENAPTAMRARLSIEHFNGVKPALRRAVTTINDNNVAVAVAGMEVAKQNAMERSIDPVRSSEQERNLMLHTARYLEGLASLDQQIQKGARRPSASAPPEDASPEDSSTK